MKARSIRGKSAEEIRLALDQCIDKEFKPTLGFVFLTDLEVIDSVMAILKSESISVFGASTSYKFSESGIEEGIAVLLMDLNPAYFKIILKDFTACESVYQAAVETGEAAAAVFSHPAFIISTADVNTPGEDVINGLLDKAGAAAPVIGGGAGEHVHFTGTIFTNHAKSNAGLLSLIVDQDKVDIKGVAVSGWKPVGTGKRITKSKGSWIYTIDNQPALEVIKKFLGRDMLAVDKSEGLDSYPLQIERESGKPMMRPVILWNEEDQSVMVGGPVKEGALFRFSLPPDLEVIDTVIESTRICKEKELPDADALIVFSCIARLSNLGPMVSTELEGLATTWNKPMVGFFSLGEYGRLDDTRPEYHGTTVSWAALKEK